MFLSAAIYLLSALIAVLVSKKLGLGSVIGYLIAGILIGPSVTGLVGEQSEVMHFAEFGVVMMLFLVGLELQPRVLWQLRTSIFGLGLLQVVLTTSVISLSLSLLTSMSWQANLTLGMMFSLSSTAIVLQTLQEKGWISEPAGKNAFSVLLFQDIAVIPMMAFLPLLAITDSANQNTHNGYLISDLPVVAQVGVSAIAIVLVVFASKHLINPVFKIIASMRVRELFTVFALFIVIAIALLMLSIGLSPALGTFLAGVALAESDFRHELESDIEPFKGLLMGLFFITVGASINFNLLMDNAVIVAVSVLGLTVIKSLLLFTLGRIFRLKGKQLSLFSVSLAQGGEFAFVLISAASSLAILNTFTQSISTIVIALSMLLAPIIFMVYEKITSKQLECDTPAPEEESITKGNVIIVGYGRFGQVIGRIIESQGYVLSILDHSITQIERVKPFGRKVFYGDGERLDLLKSAGAETADLLVIAVDDADKCMSIISLCKTHFPSLKIAARCVDRRHAYELLLEGVECMRRETLDSSVRLSVEALKLLGKDINEAESVGKIFIDFDELKLRELANAYGSPDYTEQMSKSIREYEELAKANLKYD